MKNIETQVKGNKLILTIDLSKTFGPSASGKTTIIASTGAAKPVEGMDNTFYGVNVYTKK